MKLRNKKTGEIEEFEDITRVYKFIGNQNTYISLAELEREWEDYNEEPKGYWYIDYDGGILCSESDNSSAEKMMISMGNHFESLEEAEKAVEKLKAWKRLRDKGFRFNGWNGTRVGSNISYISEVYYEGCADDMDLLFGGEE